MTTATQRSRIALLSDIHANLPALESVLADMRTRGDISATYHLGDLVGYAPWPNEVVELITRERITGVAGNYDSTVATNYKHCGCRYEDARQEALAHDSFSWSLAHTSSASTRILGGLPFRMDVRPLGGHVAGPTLRLLHGNHVLNTVYVTADRDDDFLSGMARSMGAREGDVIAFGHTHIAWHRTVGGVHFVNTGSVGRPKDGDPRAGYVLLDVAATGTHVEFIRVAYDVEKAAKAIEESTLPNEFAEYLRNGGAPLKA